MACVRTLYIGTMGRGLLRLRPLPPDWEFPIGSLQGARGNITLLRVHDVGTGYGPPYDFLDTEVVITLDSEPEKAFGLRLVTSWRLDPDKAILLESKTVGGISDERVLGSTPLYEHKPTETWRCDVSRMSAVFIDQPKAGVVITGINAGSHTIANF
jgi:hypothetical protein